MKKCLILIALIFIFYTAAHAETIIWHPRTADVPFVCATEIGVYSFNYNTHTLLLWDIESKTAEELPHSTLEQTVSLLTDGTELMGLDFLQGRLYHWQENIGWTKEAWCLDEWRDNVLEKYSQIDAYAVTKNMFFFVCNNGKNQTVYLYDRHDGSLVKKITTSGMAYLETTAANETKAAFIVSGEQGMFRYGYLHESGETEVCGEMKNTPWSNLAWREHQFYFTDLTGTLLCGDENGRITQLGRITGIPNGRGLFNQGVYYAIDLISVYRLVDENEETVWLTIAGDPGIDHQNAIDALEGIEASVTGQIFWTEDILTTALLTHDESVDIYVTEGAYNSCGHIFSKGYTYPLGAESKAAIGISHMSEALRSLVAKDGRYVALPFIAPLTKNNVSVNQDVAVLLEELGYTLPATYEQYLESLADWPDELTDEDIYPIRNGRQYRYDDWQNRTLSWYITACDPLASNAALDDALLIRLLDKSAAAYERIKRIDTPYSDEEGLYLYELTTPQRIECGNVQTLALPLAEGFEPCVEISVNTMFINPYSKNKEAAARYLDAFWENMSKENRASLVEEDLGMIENPLYQAEKDMLTGMLENVTVRLAAEKDPAVQRDLVSEQQSYENQLKALEARRFSVTSESLHAYHELLQYAKVHDISILQSTSVKNLLKQYVDKAIVTPEFVRQLHQMVLMIRMEN